MKSSNKPSSSAKPSKSKEHNVSHQKNDKKKGVTAPPPPAPADSPEDSSESASEKEVEGAGNNEDESEDEDDGVDEEGMARLMKALGDDGLDDFDRVQLNMAMGVEEDSDDEEGSEEEGSDEEGGEVEAVSGGSESESEEEAIENQSGDSDDEEGEEEDGEDGEGSDEDEDIALDEQDVELLHEDVVPKQKLVVNNEDALERIRQNIALDSEFPWTETLTTVYPHTITVDTNDDLNRELEFYKHALHSANASRKLASSSKPPLPWTRPSDFFAEMVKNDAHMERIRQRLLNESASIKKSEDKRKEREGKKFGKQVQMEKLKEREKSKKEMADKLKGLKRKRKDLLNGAEGGGDDFDIEVEDAISERPNKRSRPAGGSGSKLPRSARDKKFGFGGSGKRSKQNTRASTDNFEFAGKKGSFSAAKGGGKGPKGASGRHTTKRLGKSRRQAQGGKGRK